MRFRIVAAFGHANRDAASDFFVLRTIQTLSSVIGEERAREAEHRPRSGKSDTADDAPLRPCAFAKRKNCLELGDSAVRPRLTRSLPSTMRLPESIGERTRHGDCRPGRDDDARREARACRGAVEGHRGGPRSLRLRRARPVPEVRPPLLRAEGPRRLGRPAAAVPRLRARLRDEDPLPAGPLQAAPPSTWMGVRRVHGRRPPPARDGGKGTCALCGASELGDCFCEIADGAKDSASAAVVPGARLVILS